MIIPGRYPGLHPGLVTAHTDWQRWCDRFDKIHNGVIRLFRDRAIWRTILAMLAAYPDVACGGCGLDNRRRGRRLSAVPARMTYE